MDSFTIYILLAFVVIAIFFYIFWETLFTWKENLKRSLRERLWKYVNLSEEKENGVLSTSTDSPLQAVAHYIDGHFLMPSELPIPIDEEYLENFENEDDEDEEGFENEDDDDEEGFENEDEEEDD